MLFRGASQVVIVLSAPGKTGSRWKNHSICNISGLDWDIIKIPTHNPSISAMLHFLGHMSTLADNCVMENVMEKPFPGGKTQTLSVVNMDTWFIRRYNTYMSVFGQVQSRKACVNDAQCPAVTHYGHGKIHSRWKIRLFSYYRPAQLL